MTATGNNVERKQQLLSLGRQALEQFKNKRVVAKAAPSDSTVNPPTASGQGAATGLVTEGTGVIITQQESTSSRSWKQEEINLYEDRNPQAQQRQPIPLVRNQSFVSDKSVSSQSENLYQDNVNKASNTPTGSSEDLEKQIRVWQHKYTELEFQYAQTKTALKQAEATTLEWKTLASQTMEEVGSLNGNLNDAEGTLLLKTQEVSVLEAKVASLTEELAHSRKTLHEVERLNLDLQGHNRALLAEKEDNEHDQLNLREQLQKALSAAVESQVKVEELNKLCVQLQGSLEEASRERGLAHELTIQNNVIAERLEFQEREAAKIPELLSEIVSLQASLTNLQEQVQAGHATIQQRDLALESSQVQLQQLVNQMSQEQVQLQNLVAAQEKCKELENELQQLTSARDGEVEVLNQRIKELQEQLDAKSTQFKEKAHKSKLQLEKHRQVVAESNEKVATLEAKICELQQQVTELQSTPSARGETLTSSAPVPPSLEQRCVELEAELARRVQQVTLLEQEVAALTARLAESSAAVAPKAPELSAAVGLEDGSESRGSSWTGRVGDGAESLEGRSSTTGLPEDSGLGNLSSEVGTEAAGKLADTLAALAKSEARCSELSAKLSQAKGKFSVLNGQLKEKKLALAKESTLVAELTAKCTELEKQLPDSIPTSAHGSKRSEHTDSEGNDITTSAQPGCIQVDEGTSFRELSFGGAIQECEVRAGEAETAQIALEALVQEHVARAAEAESACDRLAAELREQAARALEAESERDRLAAAVQEYAVGAVQAESIQQALEALVQEHAARAAEAVSERDASEIAQQQQAEVAAKAKAGQEMLEEKCEFLTSTIEELTAQIAELEAAAVSAGSAAQVAELRRQVAEAEGRYAEAEKELLEVSDLRKGLAEAEVRCAVLEGQVVEMADLRKQLAEAQAHSTTFEQKVLEALDLHRQLADAQARSAELEEKVAVLSRELADSRAQSNTLEAQLLDVDALSRQLADAEARSVELEGKVSELSRQLTEAHARIAAAEKVSDTAEVNLELVAAQARCVALEEQAHELNRQLAEDQDWTAAPAQKVSEDAQKLADTQARCVELEEKLVESTKQLGNTQARCATLEDKLSQAKVKFQRQQSQLKEYKGKSAEDAALVTSLREERDDFTSKLTQATTELLAASQQIAELANSLEQLQAAKLELESKVEQLNSQLLASSSAAELSSVMEVTAQEHALRESLLTAEINDLQSQLRSVMKEVESLRLEGEEYRSRAENTEEQLAEVMSHLREPELKLEAAVQAREELEEKLSQALVDVKEGLQKLGMALQGREEVEGKLAQALADNKEGQQKLEMALQGREEIEGKLAQAVALIASEGNTAVGERSQEEWEGLETQVTQLKRQVDDSEARIAELKAENLGLEASIANIEAGSYAEINRLCTILESSTLLPIDEGHEPSIASAITKASALVAQIGDHRSEIMTLSSRILDLTSRVATLETELQAEQARNQDLQTQAGMGDGSNDKELSRLEFLVETYADDLASRTEELQDAQQRLETALAQVRKLEGELMEAAQKQNELSAELAQCRQALAATRDMGATSDEHGWQQQEQLRGIISTTSAEGLQGSLTADSQLARELAECRAALENERAQLLQLKQYHGYGNMPTEVLQNLDSQVARELLECRAALESERAQFGEVQQQLGEASRATAALEEWRQAYNNVVMHYQELEAAFREREAQISQLQEQVASLHSESHNLQQQLEHNTSQYTIQISTLDQRCRMLSASLEERSALDRDLQSEVGVLSLAADEALLSVRTLSEQASSAKVLTSTALETAAEVADSEEFLNEDNASLREVILKQRSEHDEMMAKLANVDNENASLREVVKSQQSENGQLTAKLAGLEQDLATLQAQVVDNASLQDALVKEQSEHAQLIAKLAAVGEENEALQEVITRQQSEHELLTAKLAALEQDFVTQQAQVVDSESLQVALVKAQSEHAQLMAKLATVGEENEALQEVITRQQSEHELLTAKLAGLEQDLVTQQAQVVDSESLQVALVKAQSEHAQLMAKLATVGDENEALREVITRQQLEYEQLTAKLASVEQDLANLQAQVVDNASLQDALVKERSEHDQLMEKLASMEHELGTLQARCSDMDAENRLLSLQLQGASEDSVGARRAAEGAEEKLAEADKAMKEVEEKLAAAEAEIKEAEVLRVRVAELEQQVANNQADASGVMDEAIQELRREVDIAREEAENERERLSIFKDRIEELTALLEEQSVKLEYLPQLSATVAEQAEHLESATAKCVELEAALKERSEQASLARSQLVQSQEELSMAKELCAQLSEQVARSEEEYRVARDEVARLNAECDRERETLRGVREQCESLGEELQTKAGEVAALKEGIDRFEGEIESRTKELALVRSKCEELELELTQAKGELLAVRSEYSFREGVTRHEPSELQEKAEEVAALECDRDRLRQELETEKSELAGERMKCEGLETELAQAEGELLNMKAEYEKLESTMQRATSEMQAKSEDVLAVGSECSRLKEELEVERGELDSVRTKCEELAMSLLQAEEELLVMKNEFSKLEGASQQASLEQQAKAEEILALEHDYGNARARCEKLESELAKVNEELLVMRSAGVTEHSLSEPQIRAEEVAALQRDCDRLKEELKEEKGESESARMKCEELEMELAPAWSELLALRNEYANLEEALQSKTYENEELVLKLEQIRVISLEAAQDLNVDLTLDGEEGGQSDVSRQEGPNIVLLADSSREVNTAVTTSGTWALEQQEELESLRAECARLREIVELQTTVLTEALPILPLDPGASVTEGVSGTEEMAAGESVLEHALEGPPAEGVVERLQRELEAAHELRQQLQYQASALAAQQLWAVDIIAELQQRCLDLQAGSERAQIAVSADLPASGLLTGSEQVSKLEGDEETRDLRDDVVSMLEQGQQGTSEGDHTRPLLGQEVEGKDQYNRGALNGQENGSTSDRVPSQSGEGDTLESPDHRASGILLEEGYVAQSVAAGNEGVGKSEIDELVGVLWERDLELEKLRAVVLQLENERGNLQAQLSTQSEMANTSVAAEGIKQNGSIAGLSERTGKSNAAEVWGSMTSWEEEDEIVTQDSSGPSVQKSQLLQLEERDQQLARLAFDLAELQKVLASRESELQQAYAQVDQQAEQLQKMQSHTEEMKGQAERHELLELRNLLATRESELQQVYAYADQQAAEVQKIQSQIEELNRQSQESGLLELQNLLAVRESELQQMHMYATQQAAELQKMQSHIELLNGQGAVGELSELQNMLLKRESELQQMHTYANEQAVEMQKMKSQIEQLTRQEAEAVATSTEAHVIISELHGKCAHLERRILELNNSCNALTIRNGVLETQDEELRDQSHRMSLMVLELQQRVTSLSSALEDAEARCEVLQGSTPGASQRVQAATTPAGTPVRQPAAGPHPSTPHFHTPNSPHSTRSLDESILASTEQQRQAAPSSQEVQASMAELARLRQEVERLQFALSSACEEAEACQKQLQWERTRHSQAASSLDSLTAELESSRMARSQLEVALRVERRRVEELYSQQGTSRGGAGGSGLDGSGKKSDEGSSWDPEAAALHGGSTTFQPLSGLVRGRHNVGPWRVLVRLMMWIDRMTVALYRSPGTRAFLLLYLIALHAGAGYCWESALFPHA